MDQTSYLLTILGMGAVTYLPRLLPLLALRRTSAQGSVPSPLAAWLRHVPVAVLAAMVLQSLLPVDGNTRAVQVHPLYLGAALPTAWVAWRTRSIIAAVLTGTALVALGRWALP